MTEEDRTIQMSASNLVVRTKNEARIKQGLVIPQLFCTGTREKPSTMGNAIFGSPDYGILIAEKKRAMTRRRDQ